MNELSIIKGDKLWLEMTLERGRDGLNVWIRADEALENFIKGLGSGKTELLEAYSKEWYGFDEANPIRVYHVDGDLKSGTYTINHPGEAIRAGRNMVLNLSFLRFKGLSSPEGVKFCITGPFSKTYAKELRDQFQKGIAEILREYVTPINLTLRVSSLGV